MHLYDEVSLVGNFFVLSDFQIERFNYKDWPKHESYILLYGDFKIVVNENTKLIPFVSDVPKTFCLYPLVPSIKTLMHDRGSVNVIVGTHICLLFVFLYFLFTF